MAASANPSGNQHESSSINGVSAPQTNTSNGNSDTSGPGSGLMHTPAPGIATDWTPDEQATLEEGLITYASCSPVMRYSKIASTLKNKTVRDVALRCRFMNKKEVSKRRKEEPSRKSKDKREKVADPSAKPSNVASRPGGPPYSVPNISIDNDDGISYKAIGGPTGRLLEQNAEVFQQISSNFSCYRIQENINFLCQARDNIVKILNSLNDTPEIMKQMPPLPVKLNEELANSILPQAPTSHTTQQ